MKFGLVLNASALMNRMADCYGTPFLSKTLEFHFINASARFIECNFYHVKVSSNNLKVVDVYKDSFLSYT